jgi:hypothetical protein
VIAGIKYVLASDYMTGRTLHLDGGRHLKWILRRRVTKLPERAHIQKPTRPIQTSQDTLNSVSQSDRDHIFANSSTELGKLYKTRLISNTPWIHPPV